MNILRSALLVAALGLCVPLAAYADNECAKYTTEYDVTYCYAKLFVQSDQDLNDNYKDLMKVIKPDVQKQLRSAQRDWLKYRDATCSNGGTINVDCNYRVNVDRTQYLHTRALECKAGTCRDDLIAKESWTDSGSGQ